jgi:hypothetical protein
MQQQEFVKATNLDEAWSNFDPLAPLPGEESPFYVSRPGEPLGRLTRALLHTFTAPPKFFFAGYRGSGKSTELNRLASNPDIQKKYVVVKFSIYDTSDVNNLDYRDVLLALGAQMFTQYTERGGRLDPDLLKELDGWKGTVVTRLQEKGAVFEGGAGIDLSRFFLSALLKVKTEHATRQLIREEIGPRLTELIEKINLIAASIQAREKRPVLVIIDDLDKPLLEQAEAIFFRNFAAITQPTCAIVYTVPAAILFSDVFMVSPIRESCCSLPNVKLHPQGCDEVAPEGYQTMREVALRRMDEALIEADTLEGIVALSGGVFRELTFALRAAISNAQSRGAERVELPDVDWARNQLRNPLLRLLSDEDIKLLKWVQTENPFHLPDPKKNARLLHILAVLQYADGPDWFDVHPALGEALT